MAIPITTQFDSQSNEEYFKLKIRRQRCQRKNFYFKVTATDKLIRVHRRFSKLSGIPARSFVLTFNGRVIQPDDTPLTLEMRMEGDKRIKIEYSPLPTINDFDLLGLSDIFPEEQLFGLSRVPWSKNYAHLWKSIANRRKMMIELWQWKWTLSGKKSGKDYSLYRIICVCLVHTQKQEKKLE